MRGAAVELLVERPALVQHAVKNVRCDPPRRETRHFGGQGESLRRHGAGTSREVEWRFARCALTIERSGLLTCEYAKYKNRFYHFTVPVGPLFLRVERSAD